jgi:glycosyltransferase involved in cell wall biosynthesis
VLLEALACGTPVVATRVWGTPELVTEGRHGLLVDSAEPSALGAALADALRRDWDRGAIASHGRSFSWAAAAETVERALAAMGGERP